MEADSGLYWQIEHNGSWHAEISDENGHFYLALSDPTEVQSHWFKILKPGESFTTVPVAVGVSGADFDQAMGQLTDRSRYQLDFRNPAVIEHVNEVIDRVVNQYGVGYIKMNYNIEPGRKV